MDKREIFEGLVKAIHYFEKMSGRPLSKIELDTKAIGGLFDFDSYRGLEVTTKLETDLGIFIDHGINLFITVDKRRAATIKEVVDRIHSLIQGK